MTTSDYDAMRKLKKDFNLTPDGLPSINVNGKFLRELSAEALNALTIRNGGDPHLFVRGNALTRLIRKDGAASADALTKDSLRGVLDRTANFITEKMDKDTKEIIEAPARPPKDMVADILSLPEYKLPPLRAIAGAPVLLPSGAFLSTDGYDPDSGIYLYMNGLSAGVRHDMPLNDARNLLLDELFVDFPFTDDASKAHTLAHLLLPFLRPHIEGATPLLLLDAPARGTGKGLVADIMAIIALGHPAWVMSPPDSEDEMKKTITALLTEGSPMILLDNVQKLSSDTLSAAITATLWRGRLLGQSKILEIPNRSVWIATGNNVQMSDEMARRTILCRLDAGVERPEDRKVFKHPIPAWVFENRVELVSACLSIISAWVNAGTPRGEEVLGRFQEWAGIIGGILKVAGVKGFLANRDEMHQGADSETEEWIAFCKLWWTAHEELPVTAKDLFEIAKSNGLLRDVYGGRSQLAATQRIGHALRRRRDRVFGQYAIRSAKTDSSTGNAAYRLELKSDGGKEQNTGNTGEHLQGSRCFENEEAQNTVPGHAGIDSTNCVSGVSGVSYPSRDSFDEACNRCRALRGLCSIHKPEYGDH